MKNLIQIGYQYNFDMELHSDYFGNMYITFVNGDVEDWDDEEVKEEFFRRWAIGQSFQRCLREEMSIEDIYKAYQYPRDMMKKFKMEQEHAAMVHYDNCKDPECCNGKNK